MHKPVFYKPAPKWHFFAALLGAVAIEVAVVAAASLGKEHQAAIDNGMIQEPFEVTGVQSPTEEPPPSPLQDRSLPLPPPDDTDFVLTAPTPPSHSTNKIRREQGVKTGVSRATRAGTGTASYVPGESHMIFSPHPSYPFEARRTSQTGSGKFLLWFDSNGEVTEVDTIQSAGSKILDQVSIRALREWRCQPGIYESVCVPITFTLNGAEL